MSRIIYNSHGDFVSIPKLGPEADARTIVIPGQRSLHIKYGHRMNYVIKAALIAFTGAITAYLVMGTNIEIDDFFWLMCAFFIVFIVTFPLNRGFIPSFGATKITIEPKFFSGMQCYEGINYFPCWGRNDMHDIISLLDNDNTRADMISLLYAAQDGDINIWNCRKTFNNMKTVGLTDDNYRLNDVRQLIDKYDYQANVMREMQA